MKKLLVLAVVLVLFMGFFAANPLSKVANAAESQSHLKTIEIWPGKTIGMVNGDVVYLDQPPVIINGRTMVPIRFIADTFGAKTSWNDKTKEVTIELLGKKIVLKIDSSSASVNGKTVALDSPATIIKSTGRTVVPVRFVSETFNSHVSWDDQTKAAIIEFSPDWLTKNVTVELYYPVASGAPIAKIIQGYINDFNKEYPYITIKPVFSGGYTDVKTAIQTTISGGGKPPALAVMLSTDLYDLVNGDIVIPLDGYFNTMPTGKNYLADFFPAFLANSYYNGKLWSIPFQRSIVVLYYNADLLQQAGLNPPDSWESLATTAQKLTIPGKRWGIKISSDWPYWLFQPLAIGNGQNIFNSPTDMQFNNPKVIEAVQYYIDLSHKYHAMPEGVQASWNTDPGDFAKGAAAMIFHSTANLTTILSQANFKVGVMPIPGSTKGTYATVPGGGNLYIIKGAPVEEQDAAWVFIKFVTQPKYAADFSIQTGYIASRKSAYETDAMKAYVAKVPQALTIRDSLKYAGAEFYSVNLGQVRDIFHKYLQAAFNGQMTPKEAMDKAEAEAQKVIKGGD